MSRGAAHAIWSGSVSPCVGSGPVPGNRISSTPSTTRSVSRTVFDAAAEVEERLAVDRGDGVEEDEVADAVDRPVGGAGDHQPP